MQNTTAIMVTPELKAALAELQHVKTVWFDEAGQWYFFSAVGTVISQSRDEILGIESEDTEKKNKKK